MTPQMHDALDGLEKIGHSKLARKIYDLLPLPGAGKISALHSIECAREALEIVQVALDEAAPLKGDLFDLSRVELIQALDAEAAKVGKVAA